MSKGQPKIPSPLSRAISAEVRVLQARENWDRKTLAEQSGIKVGRLGYLLREEAVWNVLELEQISDTFLLEVSTLVASAENTMGGLYSGPEVDIIEARRAKRAVSDGHYGLAAMDMDDDPPTEDLDVTP